ncbi:hypothetical protein Scep_014281 [Stephania cephalantha]|uniref:Uncharacterized protein n=1 Tax=Stephania cephalantha TaxID=152367 RepID=A0AAP0J1Q2_9MAGN
MEGCVVPVLCPTQPLRPLLRPLTNETAEIRLQTAVHYFTLPIRLRVVGGAPIQFSTLEAEQLTPKMAEKNFVAIRDNAERETMKADNSMDKGSSHCLGGERVFQWEEVAVLTKSIHDDQDGIPT